ncbi:MAG: adenine deaminase [Nitrospirae bacterium]|nr:MAG: adenine deaminase [Nitrospirota bacterium]
MDVAGAVSGEPGVAAKIEAFRGRPVDGHAPGLAPPRLDAYCAAGVTNDHEATSYEEGLAKLRRGMALFLRAGSVADDLDALLPLVTPERERWCALCTDDRHPDDLLARGSVEEAVRRAMAAGLDPVAALRLATLNPATLLGLRDRGALVPGRLADLVVLEELASFTVAAVYVGGRRVSEAGRLPPSASPPDLGPVAGRCRVDWRRSDLSLPARPGPMRILEVPATGLWTRCALERPPVRGAEAVPDPARDLAKLVVFERHQGSGRTGRCLARGLGLRRGALASTVCHDHHNLIAAGCDDRSIRTAARAAAEAGGGLAVAVGEEVVARLPLPVAGLMSDRPLEEVAAGLARVNRAARELGTRLDHPFMTLSFLGLEVIPEVKLTDRGLVEVGRGAVVDLYAA